MATACQSERPSPVPDETRDNTLPIVGGACTYEPLAFRAVVDSVASNRAVLVQVLDSLPANAPTCLREGPPDRWWVPAPAEPIVSGDTIDVSGQVIVTGTCSPCSLTARRVTPR